MSEFLTTASKEQKEVILADNINNSPIVVIAWAWSWKTTTIVNRIWYNIEEWINPSNILALSFSNKSAREIWERIKNKVWNNSNWLTTWTFHSLALKLMKEYNPNFSKYKILDEDDNQKFIKKIYISYYGDTLKQLKEDLKKWILTLDEYDVQISKISNVNDILWCVSRSKNTNENIYNLIINKIVYKLDNIEISRPDSYISYKDTLFSVEEYEKFQENIVKIANDIDFEELDLLNLKFLVKTIKDYENQKINERYLTFDDLLINIVVYLKWNDLIRNSIDTKYKYVYVDEFQDVNYIQFEFLKLINKDYNHLVVVWDSDQSIYSFRWCDSYYFQNMKNIFPETRIYFLNDNYRSDWHIVATANLSIENNKNRYKKEMNNIKLPLNVPKLIESYYEKDLNVKIINIISEIYNNSQNYNEIAILYRNNSHSYSIQKTLIEYKIPFKVVGWQNILNKKYSKDIAALLHISQWFDQIFLERIITMYPKIGEKKAEKILNDINKIKSENWDIFEQIKVLWFIKELQPLYRLLYDFNKNIINLKDLINKFYNDLLINDIYKNIESDKIVYEKESVESFINLIFEMIDNKIPVDEILENITLDNINQNEIQNVVTLSTIHRAKWLEWDNVFIIKAYDSVFPNFKSANIPFLLEEERNVFYVSITRAKENLYLCIPQAHFVWYEEKGINPSMFVTEIDEYLEK